MIKLSQIVTRQNRMCKYLHCYLLVILTLGCNSSYLKYDNKKIYFQRERNACILLKILSDSSFINSKEISLIQFRSIIYSLERYSKISPQWYCGYDGCAYRNLSLNKSLYKIDIIKWTQYYNCENVLKTLPKSKGKFNNSEMEYFCFANKNGAIIDTSLILKW